MSSAGHIADMINRIAYNRSLRQPYRDRHNRIREAFETKIASIKKCKPVGLEISKEELKKIKEDIRKTIKKERIIATIKTSVVSLIVALAVAYLIYILLFSRA